MTSEHAAGGAANGAPETTLRAMIAIIAAVALVGLTFGYTLPLLALIMEEDGIGPVMIGLSAAAESAAILAMGPFVPRILREWGLRTPMFAAVAIGVIMMVVLYFCDPRTAWFPLRFILGAAIFLMLITTDIWITQGAGAARRGRMIAIYGTAATGGIAAGPLLVPLTGTEGILPFLVGAGALAASAVPLLFAWGPAPSMGDRARLSLGALVSAVPLLVAAVLAFGLLDAAVLSLMPIYGLRRGLDEAGAVLLVTILVAGSILLQFPIGWLADRVAKPRVLVGCAFAGLGAAVVFPLVFDLPWLLWPCLFVIGGAMVGVYIVSLAILGDRYSGGTLAAAISGTAMAYALGSTAGPLLTGAALRGWDPYGFNVIVAAAFGLILVVAALFRGDDAPRPAHDA